MEEVLAVRSRLRLSYAFPAGQALRFPDGLAQTMASFGTLPDDFGVLPRSV